jgi:hypothetical protein
MANDISTHVRLELQKLDDLVDLQRHFWNVLSICEASEPIHHRDFDSLMFMVQHHGRALVEAYDEFRDVISNDLLPLVADIKNVGRSAS